MSNHSPSNNPIKWFFNTCLLLLFGVIALSVAIDLLRTNWPWFLGIFIIAGIVVVAAIAWQHWRRPW
jgi:uncharacterized membrane protein YdbT with pleckstrin-like domain